MTNTDEFNTLMYSLWNQGTDWLSTRGIPNPDQILIAGVAVSVLLLILVLKIGSRLLGRPRRLVRHNTRLRYNTYR